MEGLQHTYGSAVTSLVAALICTGTLASDSTFVSGSCKSGTLATLQQCLLAARTRPIQIDLASDLEVDASDCAAELKNASVLSAGGVRALDIDGHGHRISVVDPASACSVLDIRGASDVSVRNLNILFTDERACDPLGGCAPAIRLSRSAGIRLDSLSIRHSPGTAVQVEGVEDLDLRRIDIENAGLIGIYVGPWRGPGVDWLSRRVSITDSRISGADVNGMALVDVQGSPTDPTRISGTTFSANHGHGRYPSPAGKPYNGGQVYVVRSDGVVLEDNVFGESACPGCDNPDVWDIELGPGPLDDVTIADNHFSGGRTWAIYANDGTRFGATPVIRGNTLPPGKRLTNIPQP